MTITKTFVQISVSNDCEARYWAWVDTNKTYEEEVKRLAKEWDGWFNGVRLVEKTFNEETFTITTKVIKTTERVYEHFRWNGKVEEKVEK